MTPHWRGLIMRPPRVYMPPTQGGAIAQLGERLNGIQEVVGSIPIGSTRVIQNLSPDLRAPQRGLRGVIARLFGRRPDTADRSAAERSAIPL